MTRTELYEVLKEAYPTDTVDITEYRVLIVSDDFEGLDKFQDRADLVYNKVPGLPVTMDLALRLMTLEEVKTQALESQGRLEDNEGEDW